MAKKLSAEVWEQRVNEAGNGRYEFVRWYVDGEFGSLKKCVVKCVKDCFEWSSMVGDLVNVGKGCPQCAGNRRWNADERIEQINKIDNLEFVCWADGYKNAFSKANVRCETDGFVWSASVCSLVNKGSGCPHCAGNRRWTADERIKQINSLENIEFVSWLNGYKNSSSKANVRCCVDGLIWTASVNHLINHRCGCPQCANQRKWTSEERIEQINKLEGIEFVSWHGCYKNKNSKANVRCTVDNLEWSASIGSLVNGGHGCPKCARTGYDPSKKGYLYALRSECGRYVKVGISNKPSKRHSQLEKRTPFKFNLIEQISGDGVKISELEKYFHEKYERAGFVGFDGCTEWLICTPELLEELRNLGDK